MTTTELFYWLDDSHLIGRITLRELEYYISVVVAILAFHIQ